MNKYKQAFLKLEEYVERENYMGYDPYDFLNTKYNAKRLPHFLQFILTQINKRSPLNLRVTLGVKKAFHTKAMALFLEGYCNLYSLTGDKVYLEKANIFVDWMKKNMSILSVYNTWGFDYAYANRKSIVPKDTPTIIHHGFIVRALYKYYLFTSSEEVEKLICDSENYILKSLPLNKYDEGTCFGYHEGAIGCCYNASLHAAESLAIIDKVNDNNRNIDLIRKTVLYVLSRQRNDGSWYYSHGTNTNIEKRQIDFHQGFILDCLKNIDELTEGKLNINIKDSWNLGLKFYYSEQFDRKGRSLFRIPLKYPTDIHNQAQGIITFSKFADSNEIYEQMATSVLSWTIDNMQDSKGYFYYQKYRLFTNKISHIRWAQAWMFMAISDYLICVHKPTHS